MDKARTSYAGLILAFVLLLLPVLYLGSYFELVVPGCQGWQSTHRILLPYRPPYRMGGRWSSSVFWPLEQIDRRVRPKAWRFVLPDGSESPTQGGQIPGPT